MFILTLIVALEEKSRNLQTQQDSSSGTHMSVQNFVTIHHVDVMKDNIKYI